MEETKEGSIFDLMDTLPKNKEDMTEEHWDICERFLRETRFGKTPERVEFFVKTMVTVPREKQRLAKNKKQTTI